MKAELPEIIILKMTGDEYRTLIFVLNKCIEKTKLGGDIKSKIEHAVALAIAEREEDD